MCKNLTNCFAFLRLFTVNEAIDLIENDDEYAEADIFIMPPEIQDGDTDEDSGEDDVAPVIENLNSRQLKARCSVTLRNRSGEVQNLSDTESDSESESDEEDTQRAPTRKKATRVWNKTDLRHGDNPFPMDNWISDKNLSPATLFELFFDDELIEHILNMSTLYAQQSNKPNFTMTEGELKVTLAILIISGYAPLPRRRMYWENSEDSFNSAVANSMSVNRFEEILRYLHFADNFNLNQQDKMAKMRPLFTMLNEKYLAHWIPEQDINVDESMAPYYGRHGSKQYIRGKPIRYGYKLWCLNTPTGYLIQTEPYQGKGTVKVQPHLGMCGSVVVDLLSELPERNYNVYFDNLFTSLSLLEELKLKNMNGTGTLRQNRSEKCPLPPVNNMKKLPRGSVDYRVDRQNKIIVIRWNDNSVVTVASTLFGVAPMKRVQRYSQAQKQQIQVPIPDAVAKYNKSMGGTDRMDQNIANYRVSMRIKKWWWPLFSFCLMTSTHNAWILHRKSSASSLDYLGFLRQLALSYIFRYRKAVQCQKIPGKTERAVAAEAKRVDVHLPISIPTQRRCRVCNGNTKKACNKCPNTPLHEKCFAIFSGHVSHS